MRTPLTNDAELQARDQVFAFRQHSYELTQKLTYFVISIELIFCGYLLLNAEKLVDIRGASFLFAITGIAAFFGIFWRFFYNQTYHNNAHGTQGLLNKVACLFQIIFYWIYIALSIASFVWALFAGFTYLDKTNSTKKAATSSHNNTKNMAAPSTQSISPNYPETQKGSQESPNIKDEKDAVPTKPTPPAD
jgi:hypothetical protein